MLPSHKLQKPIEQPLIFEGLGVFALSGWHRHYRKHNNVEKCLEIEAVVSQMSESDRYWIKRISFYRPVKS